MYKRKCGKCQKPMTRTSFKEEVSDDPKRDNCICVTVTYKCHFCGNFEREQWYRHRRTKS